jgi:hypothetical protein
MFAMTVAVIACAACSRSARSRIGGSLRATSTRSKPSPRTAWRTRCRNRSTPR